MEPQRLRRDELHYMDTTITKFDPQYNVVVLREIPVEVLSKTRGNRTVYFAWASGLGFPARGVGSSPEYALRTLQAVIMAVWETYRQPQARCEGSSGGEPLLASLESYIRQAESPRR